MNNNRKFGFGFNFQLDLIKLSLESVGFMLLCNKYVKPDYFSSDRFEYFVNHIYKYYDKYGLLPDKTFLKTICREKKDFVFVRNLYKKRVIREDFIRDKVEDFVKRSLFINYYNDMGELYNKNPGKPDLVYDLMLEANDNIKSISLKQEKFNFLYRDFEKRLQEREYKLQTQKIFKVKTGIRQLDIALKGGVSGGEVAMFLADAKGGKSLGLIHCGTQAVKRYIPTLHFQLEGKIDETLDRYDACYVGALYDEVVKNEMPKVLLNKMRRIAKQRKNKDLIIRGTEDWDSFSILDIERDFLELKERGYDFKLVIIDYMDLMKARKHYDDERFRQQSIIRDIKSFAVKYNVAVWTATQANRRKDDDQNDPNFIYTSKNISEDYGKVRAIDILVTINSTDVEIEKGFARIFLDMARNYSAKKLMRIRRALDRSMFYVQPGTIIENGIKKRLNIKK